MGGLGIPIFHQQPEIELTNSETLTHQLSNDIINQNRKSTIDENEQKEIKSHLKKKSEKERRKDNDTNLKNA